jgi:hypothetical protein
LMALKAVCQLLLVARSCKQGSISTVQENS